MTSISRGSGIVNCNRTHHLELENLKDYDIIEHSLLLLKGRVLTVFCNKQQQQVQQLKATLETAGAVADVTGVVNAAATAVASCTTAKTTLIEQLTHLSNAGEFKLLFDLTTKQPIKDANITELILRVRYCSAELFVHFYYKKRRSFYRIQPLYLLCQDDAEQTTATIAEKCEIIDLNLRLVQCIYAYKLRAAGYANCTFTLNDTCQVFRTHLSCSIAQQSSEDELWQYFATDILASETWGQQLHLKFIAFIGCTLYDGAAVAASGDYSYANIRRHLKAHAALGGGGLALFGTGHFYAWPRHFHDIADCIRSTQRVDCARLPDDSNYRRTYGGVYASTLGAVCHELGHCFDLGHTVNGIMGHGFDYLDRVLIVDKPTENLPKRLINNIITTPSAQITIPATTGILTRPHFTHLKPLKQYARNNFLDKYREQRKNDLFYFTHNCAIILAHHKWLRPNQETSTTPAATTTTDNTKLKNVNNDDVDETSTITQIKLKPANTEIVSTSALKLVELRCNINSLVAHYEEFEDNIYRYQLSSALWDLVGVQQSHYVFVLTRNGVTKRLTLEAK